MNRYLPEFDASLFRLSRFSDGGLIRGRYDYSITGKTYRDSRG